MYKENKHIELANFHDRLVKHLLPASYSECISIDAAELIDHAVNCKDQKINSDIQDVVGFIDDLEVLQDDYPSETLNNLESILTAALTELKQIK